MKAVEYYKQLASLAGMEENDDVLLGYKGKNPLKSGNLVLPTPNAIDIALDKKLMLYSPSRESLTGNPSITLTLTAAQASLHIGKHIEGVILEAFKTIASTSKKSIKESTAATKVVTLKGSKKSYKDVARVISKATSTNKPYLLKFILTEKNQGADNIYYRRIVSVGSPLLTIVDNKLKSYKRAVSKTVGPSILGVKMSKTGLEMLSSILHNVLDPILEEPEGSDNSVAPYTEALVLKIWKSLSTLNDMVHTSEAKTLISIDMNIADSILKFSNKPGFKKAVYSIVNTEGNNPQLRNNEIKSIKIEQEEVKPKLKPKKKAKKTKAKKRKKSKVKMEVEILPSQPPQNSSIFKRGKAVNQFSQPNQNPASMGTRRMPVAGVASTSSPREPVTQEVDSTNFNQQTRPQQPLPGNSQVPLDELGYPITGKELKKWKKRQKAVLKQIKAKIRRKAELERELYELNEVLSRISKQPGMAYIMHNANYAPPNQPPKWRGNQPPQGWQPPNQNQGGYGNGTGYNRAPPPGWNNQPQNNNGWNNQPPQGWNNQPQNNNGWNNQPPQGWQPPGNGGWGNQPPPWDNQPQNNSGWNNQPNVITPIGAKSNTPNMGVHHSMVRQTPTGGTSNSGSNWKVGG